MTGEEKGNADSQTAAAPTQQAAGPVVNIFATGFPSTGPSDAPAKEDSPSPQALGGLPGIATAAAAIDPATTTSPNSNTTSPSNATKTEAPASAIASGTGSTDPQLLQSENPQYQQLQPQPPRTGSISERLSATTPTTPAFATNATTPTTPFSPSGSAGGMRAKHSCPHCHQTFTRHHNLKSHLLTHSQEKPFSCNECNARFRRLHDLKRHSKLHTGERPHVCHKCGRRFARGDALARHARGEGGCAGRRSSLLHDDSPVLPAVPSGTGEPEDGMDLDNLMGDEDDDIDMLGASSGGAEGTDDIKRRASLPSIRTTDIHPVQQQLGSQTPITPASAYSQQHHQHNTYPPLGNPGNRTGSISALSPGSATRYPPPPSINQGYKPNTTTSTSPSVQATTLSTTTTAPGSATQSSAGQTILGSHGVLSDSPRAVSPGMPNQTDGARERTPSLGTSYLFSPQQTAREGVMASHSQPIQQQTSSPQQQTSTPSQQTPTTNPTGNGPAPQANMGALGAPNGGTHGNNLFSAGLDGVWSYVRNLEERVKQLEDKVLVMEGRQGANLQQQTAGSS